MAPVTGWELASEQSVTESSRPWKHPAAGAMRQRWITTMSVPAAFGEDRPTTCSPPCVTSRGRDLQRLQILQVPPVIKQSNMSRVDSPQQLVDKTLVVAQYSTSFHTLYYIIRSLHLYETWKKRCLIQLQLDHWSACKRFILTMLECSNSD